MVLPWEGDSDVVGHHHYLCAVAPVAIRDRTSTVRIAAGRTAHLLLLACGPPSHRGPGPELHGQRLGRSDISQRDGLPLP